MIRLIEILPFLEPLDTVIIWDNTPDGSRNEPLFSGSVMDIPWYIAKNYVLYSDENEDIAGLRSSQWKDDGRTKVGLIINVEEV